MGSGNNPTGKLIQGYYGGFNGFSAAGDYIAPDKQPFDFNLASELQLLQYYQYKIWNSPSAILFKPNDIKDRL